MKSMIAFVKKHGVVWIAFVKEHGVVCSVIISIFSLCVAVMGYQVSAKSANLASELAKLHLTPRLNAFPRVLSSGEGITDSISPLVSKGAFVQITVCNPGPLSVNAVEIQVRFTNGFYYAPLEMALCPTNQLKNFTVLRDSPLLFESGEFPGTSALIGNLPIAESKVFKVPYKLSKLSDILTINLSYRRESDGKKFDQDFCYVVREGRICSIQDALMQPPWNTVAYERAPSRWLFGLRKLFWRPSKSYVLGEARG